MASDGRGGGARGGASSADKAADFANYFCTYAFLYHQKDMLSDKVRMTAYYRAVFENKKHFAGKVVLDVGTGSGILAIWAAQAGARKVYAVEATDMAVHARTLVRANGVGHIVDVIQGSVEEIDIPEQVDVIISEWMGYFLVRESMFDSVIFARNKWLKPDGIMYPSHARMWLAPARSGLADARQNDFRGSMEDWEWFVQDTRQQYGVDMSALSETYNEEQRKYFLQTGCWESLHPGQVAGDAALVKELDCLTASVEDIKAVLADFRCIIGDSSPKVNAFAGWFDVQFKGRPGNPADAVVELTTAPSSEHGTHWGQHVFLLQPFLAVQSGDEIQGRLEILRSARNHRLMDVKLSYKLLTNYGLGSMLKTADYYIE